MGGLDRERCIEACRECSSLCEETARYCRAAGGRLGDPELVRALVVCAAVSRYLADLLDDDAHLVDVAHFFEEICRSCAAACERTGDERLLACADCCRSCAGCAARLAVLAEQA